jgi:hypothetical protein
MTDRIPYTLENGEINPECITAQKAAYYNQRVAYDKKDTRKMIGIYSPTGEVIPFVKPSDN